VTVSFSKYLPWQAILKRSTHFSKTCCRPLIISKFFVSEFPFHGWKSPEIAWGEIWIKFCVRLRKSWSVDPYYNIHHTVQISLHTNHEKGAPRQEISKWSTVRSTFPTSGWSIVRSASRAKGGTSKKRPSPPLHTVPNRSNKVSPRALQTTLVCKHMSRRSALKQCFEEVVYFLVLVWEFSLMLCYTLTQFTTCEKKYYFVTDAFHV
jgi:hypothetical protein